MSAEHIHDIFVFLLIASGIYEALTISIKCQVSGQSYREFSDLSRMLSLPAEKACLVNGGLKHTQRLFAYLHISPAMQSG